MPVHKVVDAKGRVGYQWGESGKVYYGKDAAKKAYAQQAAIEHAGYKEPKKGKKSK